MCRIHYLQLNAIQAGDDLDFCVFRGFFMDTRISVRISSLEKGQLTTLTKNLNFSEAIRQSLRFYIQHLSEKGNQNVSL